MRLAAAFLGALLAMTTTANPSPPVPRAVPFDSGLWKWSATGHRIEEHLGRQSLYLRDGVAWVDGARFADGAIDFDMAFTGERGFVGGIWRVQDGKGYEQFYVRPHQSGNPDATQYTPVFNGVSGWQLYHGERYSVPLVHRFNAWVHVRIVFAGAQAEVYVDDMEKPVQLIDELRRGVEPGSVGISAGQASPAHFSNFSYTVLGSPPLKGRPGTPEPIAAGVIPSWWVSDAFPESALEGRTSLTAAELGARRWTRLAAERSGLANLARVQGAGRGQDTVFARKVLLSEREQVRRLDFGFANRIRVYLNGRLLFRGDDGYRSRDYRFLGSIGYFDALYLPLAQGRNEIVMAVSEDAVLGGWGVQAKLENLAALAFED